MFAKFCFFLLLFTVVYLVVGFLIERFVSVWFFFTCLTYGTYGPSSGLSQSISVNVPLTQDSLRWFQYEECLRNRNSLRKEVANKRLWLLDLFGDGIVQSLQKILMFRGIFVSELSKVSELEQQNKLNSYEEISDLRNRLIGLVNASGEITAEELRTLCDDDGDEKSILSICDNQNVRSTSRSYAKQFTSSNFIDEEIDYDRDRRVWLFYVKHSSSETGVDSSHRQFDRKIWPLLSKRLSTIGFRLASFDCAQDPDYCRRKGWTTSQLVLTFRNFRFQNRLIGDEEISERHLIRWINLKLESQLFTIDTEQQLEAQWLGPLDQGNNNLVKMIAIMDQKLMGKQIAKPTLPLLAVRFASAGLKIGIHYTNTEKLAEFHRKLGTNLDDRLPIYLIRFRNQARIVHYRENGSTSLSYQQMELYLRGLFPENCDLLLIGFFLVNLCVALNFFWTRCHTLRKYFNLCLTLSLEFNLLLALVLHFAPPLFHFLCLFLPQWLVGLIGDQLMAIWSNLIWPSQIAATLRYQFFLPGPSFLVVFLLTGILITFVRSKLVRHYDDSQIENVFNWISFLFCFINFLLFRRTRRQRDSSRFRRTRNNHLSYDGSGSNEVSNNNLTPTTTTTLDVFDNRAENAPQDLVSDDDDDDYYDDLDDIDREALDVDDTDLLVLMLIQSFSLLPNLWLRTERFSMEYIKQLPMWHYIEPQQQQQQSIACQPKAGDLMNSEDGFVSSTFSSNSSDSSDNESESNNNNNNVSSVCSLNSAVSVSLGGCRPESGSNPNISESPNFDCSLVAASSSSSSSTDDLSCIGKSGQDKPKVLPILAESCVSEIKTEQLEPQISVKLAKQKKKILYVRKRAQRNQDSNNGNQNHKNRRSLNRNSKPEENNKQRPVKSEEDQQQQQEDCTTDRPKWMHQMDDCTICLDRYRQMQPICGLPCGHSYHAECIVEWLRRDNHCCPICRWPTYRFQHPIQKQKQPKSLQSAK